MNSVHVSVEVPLENAVHEITYEGVEILQPALSLSESLTSIAQRIDFTSKDDDDESTTSTVRDSSRKNESFNEGEGGSSGSGTGGNTDCTFKTMPAWPWESITGKLRNSLTELSVLGDILQILSQKKYMVLDPVQAEATDLRPTSSVIYKKKGLSAASAVLLSGAERIKASLTEPKPPRSSSSSSSLSSLPDFHIELLRLRQNWRLRKMGNIILGDLSYKTVGSRFPQAGIFEVSKAEQAQNLEKDSSSSSSSSSDSKPISSALKVTVPKELQGIAYIQVVILEEVEGTTNNILSQAKLGLLGPTSAPPPEDGRWQQRLEAAQNVLFCRELFAVLAREAVQVGSSCTPPPLVVGNQISASLFPGISLLIGLCHGGVPGGKSSNSSSSSSSIGPGAAPPPKLDHNHVLEHSLHQLLREIHRSNCVLPMPHPASGQIGISKKRGLAGPLAYDRSILMKMSKKDGILEEIIHQARHVILRLRTMSILDQLAKDIKDPLVVTHWASLNAVTHSCVRINLMSAGYDMTARTPLVIHIKERKLKCILKDGKAIHLSYEPQELRDIILSQVAIHQVMALQSLSKCMGWTVLSSSIHLGVGKCEALGNAAGCLLSSPNGKCTLAIRSTPHKDKSEIEIFIGMPPGVARAGAAGGVGSEISASVGVSSQGITEHEEFKSLANILTGNFEGQGQGGQQHGFELRNGDVGGDGGMIYKSASLDQLEGKNFVNKMEMLMAVLTDAVK